MAKLLVSSVIYSFQISVRKITIIGLQANNFGLAWTQARPGHRSDGLSQAKSTKTHPGRGPGLAGHQAPARQQARPTALVCTETKPRVSVLISVCSISVCVDFQVRQLRVVRHIIYSNRITGIDVKIEPERFGLDTCLFETTSQVPSRYFLPVNINLDVFYD